MGVIENTAKAYEDMVKFCEMCPSFDPSVPYFFFLRSYYDTIKKFVTAVVPNITATEFEWLTATLKADYHIDVSKVDHVKLLTSYIWQVGVVHITDHMSYAVQSLEYCFNQASDDIYDTFHSTDVDVWDRWRTRNEFNMFFGYHPNPLLTNHMEHVENYKFKGFNEACEAAAQQFKADLIDTDAKLREVQCQIYPLYGMPQSVCF